MKLYGVILGDYQLLLSGYNVFLVWAVLSMVAMVAENRSCSLFLHTFLGSTKE